MRTRFVVAAAFVLLVAAAAAAWPRTIDRGVGSAAAAGLPTMAPVVADYLERDRLVAFWERATAEHHRGDFISPQQLADQYLQRYREHNDIDDVLRAERAARLSLAAHRAGNLAGELQLAAIDLTLHRFYEALAITKSVEHWDAGDDAMWIREASLDLEVGDYSAAEHRLDAVPRRDRNDSWSVIESRNLELTGHIAQARRLLAVASAYQNENFDAPAQQRAWYFFRQGEMAFEAGDNPGALADERQAVTIYPAYADAYRTLARIECAHHDWKDCLRDATTSAAGVPYPETLGYEADAQRALGDFAAARQTDDLIGAIARLGDAQHITDRLLALYYADHHERPQLAYAIARGELRSRDDVFTEDTLAWAAAMDGRWVEAERAAKRALRYGTQNALLDYHAAVIDQHLGRRSVAARLYARALALNPTFHQTFADEARRQLASL